MGRKGYTPLLVSASHGPTKKTLDRKNEKHQYGGMMMEKHVGYESPVVLLVLFEEDDVVRTSGINGGDSSITENWWGQN